jgi:hypothetical protein
LAGKVTLLRGRNFEVFELRQATGHQPQADAALLNGWLVLVFKVEKLRFFGMPNFHPQILRLFDDRDMHPLLIPE